MIMASHANLPRPPFIGTSWQVTDFVTIWISINYTDFYLSGGSKIWTFLDYSFRCCLWVVGQQGCAREDLPPSAREGRARDSGRAWSSRAQPCCRHIMSSWILMTDLPRIAGIDTKKEASEIQKPRSGDRRSRTDDPLLAKQML